MEHRMSHMTGRNISAILGLWNIKPIHKSASIVLGGSGPWISPAHVYFSYKYKNPFLILWGFSLGTVFIYSEPHHFPESCIPTFNMVLNSVRSLSFFFFSFFPYGNHIQGICFWCLKSFRFLVWMIVKNVKLIRTYSLWFEIKIFETDSCFGYVKIVHL